MTDFGSNIAAALVALQREAPKVHKGKTAHVPTKGGGSYSYSYADLADVADAAKPLLAKHGLAFVCHPRATDRGYELAGSLVHESGESVTGALELRGGNAQALGSDLTYFRRYLLGCLTGIITDEDDDGAAGSRGDRTHQVDREALIDDVLSGLRDSTTEAEARGWGNRANSRELLGYSRDGMTVREHVEARIAELAQAAPDAAEGDAA